MVVLRHRLMPSPSAILQKHTCLIYMRKNTKDFLGKRMTKKAKNSRFELLF